jgi:hypothetical protein
LATLLLKLTCALWIHFGPIWNVQFISYKPIGTTLHDSVEHKSQMNPTQWMIKLSYLCTNFYQILVEDCSYGMCNFWVLWRPRQTKPTSVFRESTQAQKFYCFIVISWNLILFTWETQWVIFYPITWYWQVFFQLDLIWSQNFIVFFKF